MYIKIFSSTESQLFSKNMRKRKNYNSNDNIGATNILLSSPTGDKLHTANPNFFSKSILKRRVLLGIIAICITLCKASPIIKEDMEEGQHKNNEKSDEESIKCIHPSVEDFPDDFLTPEQRARGGIIIHLLIGLYSVIALCSVCDNYFVPVLEALCEKLNIPDDVAGATFMAIGTSSPELFANIIGTFITESDLGIGTIVGSAVFNIFGVIAVCGLFAGCKIGLDWYSITRDCLVYGITVLLLIICLHDGKVYLWESAGMVALYLFYIGVMFYNVKIENWAQNVKERFTRTKEKKCFGEKERLCDSGRSSLTGSDDFLIPNEYEDDDEDIGYPWQAPDGGCFAYLWWILFLPVELVFFITIPDVRRLDKNDVKISGKGGKITTTMYVEPWYAKTITKVWIAISFIMCITWIGTISYVVVWMITDIGFVMHVPDNVMGLTFLAAGTSVPEIVSSLIVCRQGKGSMAVSNSIGSNTFDILICLGLPWIIRAIQHGWFPDEDKIPEFFVKVESKTLEFTVLSLLASLVIIYVIFLMSRWMLTRSVGVACLIIYSVFMTIGLLFELNHFKFLGSHFENLPLCKSSY